MAEVRKRVDIPNVIYTGNHGLEIEYPDPKKAPFAYEMEPDIQQKYNKLVAYLKSSVSNTVYIEIK